MNLLLIVTDSMLLTGMLNRIVVSSTIENECDMDMDGANDGNNDQAFEEEFDEEHEEGV